MDKVMPLVTVLLPVYNGESTVKQTIESILTQTYRNLQVIIIDDASTDASRSIIDSFDDDRIERIYLDKNRNICVAVNEGYKHVKGEFIASIGHDDIWMPDKIEKQIRFMEENPRYLVTFTRTDIIDENGIVSNEVWPDIAEVFSAENRSREEWLFELLTYSNHFCAPSSVIRKEAIDTPWLYRAGLLQLQDYDLWIRILLTGDIYIIEEKLVLYRRFRGNTKNISRLTTETKNRGSHEQYYIQYDIISQMDDELFIRVFKEYLKNVSASSHAEIMCEKAIILLELNNCFAYKMLIELMDIEECRIILEEKCHFSINDFYKYTGEAIVCDKAYIDICDMQSQVIDKMKLVLSRYNINV